MPGGQEQGAHYDFTGRIGIMIYPSLNSLMKRVDSKYTLVVEVAKRARQLVDGEKPLIEGDISKPVSLAVNEVNDGLIFYKRTKEGIK